MSSSFMGRLVRAFVGSGHIEDTEETLEAAVSDVGSENKATEVRGAITGNADSMSEQVSKLAKNLEIVIINVYCIEPNDKSNWCVAIANAIKQEKCVIINFQETSKELRRSMLDFLSGILYCTNGCLAKITDSVILCYPNEVKVSYHPDSEKNVSALSGLDGDSSSDSKVREDNNLGGNSRRYIDYGARGRYK
ncbi:MAG: cell division protein SepF [Candidatus Bruticola sp.]